MQILCHVVYGAQPSKYNKQCVIYRPLRNCPNKLVYDVAFAGRFLHGQQMAACEQIRVAYVMC